MTLEDTIIHRIIDVINDPIDITIDTTIGNKDDNLTLHAYKPINAFYKY